MKKCELGTESISGFSRTAVKTLKACPLCGAINALANYECFSCLWSGRFSHDAEIISEGLEKLIQSCPELKAALSEERQKWPTMVSRLRKALRITKSIDLLV